MGKKVKGNGEGTIYKSSRTGLYVGQYMIDYKRYSVYQKKNEKIGNFKKRFSSILNSINQGTYIEKSNKTVKSIISEHIKQKLLDGISQEITYKRDLETLNQIEKCCSNFIDKPIQKVSLKDIQESKENMKKYATSGINRMWRLLEKSFSIASSPSIKLIPYNIMNDENLKKPISEIGTKKIMPLTAEERKRLQHVLDYEVRDHKYRNIVKIEWITAMRIGEVLARSKSDINDKKTKIHIYNTLTKNKDGKTILGKNTKTYNKETKVDDGERFFPIVDVELKSIIEQELNKKIANIYNLLFWDYDKNTFISDIEVNSWLRRINNKYKICNGTLHNHRLRHDRITQWRENGMPLEAIQYLAGHVEGSKITTEVYIDISEEYAFSQYKKIN